MGPNPASEPPVELEMSAARLKHFGWGREGGSAFRRGAKGKRERAAPRRYHALYPDGPAPYFTIHALGEPGKLGAQWLAIKSAALDAVITNGGTVTHHHAVGRDHLPWYDRQRPPLFAEALRAAKKALDPQGLLNPGVLIDP